MVWWCGGMAMGGGYRYAVGTWGPLRGAICCGAGWSLPAARCGVVWGKVGWSQVGRVVTPKWWAGAWALWYGQMICSLARREQ